MILSLFRPVTKSVSIGLIEPSPCQPKPGNVHIRGGGAKKNCGALKGSEGETRIQVLLGGGESSQSSKRFLNNYKAEFALKHSIACMYTLHVFIFISSTFFIDHY